MHNYNFLTEEQLQFNYDRFRNLINENFPTRKTQLNLMYDALQDELMLAPASSQVHFHNCFIGGYIDHVLRVYDFAIYQFKVWEHLGMNIDFELEELKFVALNHDLGKLGIPGTPHYVINNEKYQQDKGILYKQNLDNQWMSFNDRSIYLLNSFGVNFSVTEMLGIKLTDGLYDETNKQYLITYDINKKLKSNLPYIMHNADAMAARFEYERWAKL